MYSPGVMAPAFDPSTGEVEADDFEARLVYIVRPVTKTTKYEYFVNNV